MRDLILKKVGTICVDAGIVMVGDPCYTQGHDSSHGVKSWQEFLKKTYNESNDNDNAVAALGKEGIGMVVRSGWGDGEYNVYIEEDRKTGRVVRLIVEFDEFDEEEEEEEEDK